MAKEMEGITTSNNFEIAVFKKEIKFEYVSRVLEQNNKFSLPVKGSKNAAGYDFINPEEVTIQPKEIKYVKTGIKALFPDDIVLLLFNRSSNPKKKGLVMANSVGVIDKDYYGNPDNDGHFMFSFFNIKDEDIVIKKGEAIGQGIFQKYLTVDNDVAEGERVGGFGSTSK